MRNPFQEFSAYIHFIGMLGNGQWVDGFGHKAFELIWENIASWEVARRAKREFRDILKFSFFLLFLDGLPPCLGLNVICALGSLTGGGKACFISLFNDVSRASVDFRDEKAHF